MMCSVCKFFFRLKEYFDNGDVEEPVLWPYFIIIGVTSVLMTLFYMLVCHICNPNVGLSLLESLAIIAISFGIGLLLAIPIIGISSSLGILFRSFFIGFIITWLIGVILFIGYVCYRTWWPVGEYQIIVERRVSYRYYAPYYVIHRKRCEYFRDVFQKKVDFDEFLKEENYVYCKCVRDNDIKILDACTKKNLEHILLSDDPEDLGHYSQLIDTTERGHDVFYLYDFDGNQIQVESGVILDDYMKRK